MALANPVKGELEVVTSRGALILCFPWGVQKAVAKRFGKKTFREFLGGFDDLSDDDISHMFHAALLTGQPEVTEEDADAVITELGFPAAMRAMSDSIGMAYDVPTEALEEADGDPRPAPAPATK